MPFVRCSVDGCDRKLRPLFKPDPRDRDTWLYPECDLCHRPACSRHVADVGGRAVCDRCRRDLEARQSPLIDLGVRTDPAR